MKLFRPVLCAAMIAVALPALADVTRDQAAAAAQGVAPGRVLSVERAGNVWRVKIVTPQGEVKIVLIDAATGRPV